MLVSGLLYVGVHFCACIIGAAAARAKLLLRRTY